MKYPGKELEIFDKASFWRNYLFLLTKKFYGKKILEVGAGIGSFTNIYKNKDLKICLTEIDEKNFETLNKKFSDSNNIKVYNKFTYEIKEKFDTVLYLSVLEHIEDDKKEINDAIDKLDLNGHLIICVPAHNYMYSNFDKEIGHFKRYEDNFFKNLSLDNAKLKKIFFIDSFGYLLYFFNKLIFSKEVYPSKFKVLIWDKVFIPLTYVLDFLTFYKIGKNIICIFKKEL
tara:strand:+ start:2544 stop:3230 length:687 start_codon:yes stop_codon:yes gene_type:complete